MKSTGVIRALGSPAVVGNLDKPRLYTLHFPGSLEPNTRRSTVAWPEALGRIDLIRGQKVGRWGRAVAALGDSGRYGRTVDKRCRVIRLRCDVRKEEMLLLPPVSVRRSYGLAPGQARAIAQLAQGSGASGAGRGTCWIGGVHMAKVGFWPMANVSERHHQRAVYQCQVQSI